jgi:hypothetical protein
MDNGCRSGWAVGVSQPISSDFFYVAFPQILTAQVFAKGEPPPCNRPSLQIPKRATRLRVGVSPLTPRNSRPCQRRAAPCNRPSLQIPKKATCLGVGASPLTPRISGLTSKSPAGPSVPGIYSVYLLLHSAVV